MSAQTEEPTRSVVQKITQPETLSLYVHVPFCAARCDYCDFYSIGGAGDRLQQSVLGQTGRQLEHFYQRMGAPSVETVFIGGGTPSAVSRGALLRLLEAVRACTRRSPATVREWTVEVNPESTDAELLGLLSQAGVTRLSLGVQSFDDRLLRTIGRRARAEESLRALDLVAERWQGALSLDLITGIPGQTERSVEGDVRRILGYRPDHVSLYELTVEAGTVLERRIRTGLVHAPEAEGTAVLWEHAAALLKDAGLPRYEVSNFAGPGAECLHNLRYWRMRPYIGCGPSAVSTLPYPGGAVRLSNPADTRRYLGGQRELWGVSHELIDSRTLFLEHLIMGFRLAEGISRTALLRIFGLDPAAAAPRTVDSWERSGRLTVTDERLVLSEAGLSLLDRFLLEYAEESAPCVPELCSWP